MAPPLGHPPNDDGMLTRSIRNNLLIAALVSLLLIVGVGGWAALSEISGAVVARGTVVVESEVKQVQHREGGIVRRILVEEGDEIAAGDLLVQLDDMAARTNHSIIINQLAELKARRARLMAEREGKDIIAFPPRPEGESPEKLAQIELSQTHLMEARSESLSKRKEQLRDQIHQFEEQIGGLEARLTAKREELDLLDEEFASLATLFEKQLVTRDRMAALKRDRTRLNGEHSELSSEIASHREAISERRMQSLQIDEESRAEILRELQDVTSEVAELELQRVKVEDELNRLQVRAPRAGYVHQLAFHTIGAVVPPGETIMQIVPRDDLLVIDAEVAPSDIDQLYLGQEAMIRFPGLDNRTTPRLAARVERIAADQTLDEATNVAFYKIRLRIPKEELAKLDGQTLVPGMPVETFVTTGSRTVLAYLTKPIVDQIAHAMKES